MIGGQQSEINSLNYLGKQIIDCNDSKIRELVRTHLDGLNENWVRVKDKVLAEPSVFAPISFEPEVSLGANEESQWKDESSMRHVSSSAQPVDGYVDDNHLKYQLMFSDLFDWLVKCEERLRRKLPKSISIEELEKISTQLLVNAVT